MLTSATATASSTSYNPPLAPAPLLELFGFRNINALLRPAELLSLYSAQGNVSSISAQLARPLFYHPQIACQGCTDPPRKCPPSLEHTCLHSAITITAVGQLRIGPCWTSVCEANYSCSTSGLRLSLEPTPIEAVWKEWEANGFRGCETVSWACYIERWDGRQMVEEYLDQAWMQYKQLSTKRKRTSSPLRQDQDRRAASADADGGDADYNALYGIGPSKSKAPEVRLKPSSSYRPGQTSTSSTPSVATPDKRFSIPAAPQFSSKPLQSFRPGPTKCPPTPSSPATPTSAQSGSLIEKATADPIVRSLRLPIKDHRGVQTDTVHQETPRSAPAESSRAMRVLQDDLERQRKATGETQVALQQMTKMRNIAEASLSEVRKVNQQLMDDLDRMRQSSREEAPVGDGQGGALATCQAERDAALGRIDSLKQSVQATVDRLREAEARTETVRAEKQSLVTELEAAKKERAEGLAKEKAKTTALRKQSAEHSMRNQELLKQGEATARETKSKLDAMERQLQEARTLSGRLEITRQRQMEEIELLRKDSRESTALHDEFAARTTQDRANFLVQIKELKDKVKVVEGQLAAEKEKAKAVPAPTKPAEKAQTEPDTNLIRAENAERDVEKQKQLVADLTKKLAEEQAKAEKAWAATQRMINENGKNASEQASKVAQGKKDAEASIKAKDRELDAMRKALALEKDAAKAARDAAKELEAKLDKRPEAEGADGGERLKEMKDTIDEKDAKIARLSSKLGKVRASRDAATREVEELRAKLERLAKSPSVDNRSGTSDIALPTPTSMHDDLISTPCPSRSQAIDHGPPEPEWHDDTGSIDQAVSEIRAKDKQIAALQKQLDKAASLEIEVAKSKKLVTQWSKRVETTDAIIKINAAKIKDLERERATKWKKGTNPVYMEMRQSDEIDRLRMMLRATQNEILPKCSCGMSGNGNGNGNGDGQRLNLADKRDRLAVVVPTRSKGQHPVWKDSDSEGEVGGPG